MSPERRRGPTLWLALALAACCAGSDPTGVRADAPLRELAVCADPNNLPFSNRAGEGFENKLAVLLAHDLAVKVRYVWWAQRRGYIRNTLGERRCDLWLGVASGIERLDATAPYYRSTYEFVTRADRPLGGLTLDDPRLRSLSIGVQMVGNDAMNTPPAHALARRGLTDNVHGYMLYGNYEQPNPPARIVEAVSSGEVDVALVWGPLAGYFAAKSPVALRLEPIEPGPLDAPWPMSYDIAVGVRRDAGALRDQVAAILLQRRPAIDSLLRAYHVPLARVR